MILIFNTKKKNIRNDFVAIKQSSYWIKDGSQFLATF